VSVRIDHRRLYELEDPASAATHTVVATRPGITVTSYACAKGPESPLTRAVYSDFGLMLVRRGGFERRARGNVQFVDTTTAYFSRPSVVQELRHPREGGDEGTLINMSEAAIVALAGDGELPDDPIPTSAAIDLMHVTLLARLADGLDDFELEELVSVFVGRIIEQGAPGRLTTRRRDTESAHRLIVDRIREAIAADPSGVNIGRLAAELGHSRFHVSRVFRRVTGLTMTQHRNRVRISEALTRLAAGQRNLASLAADLGFADQSHLCRVVRAALGEPPSRLRDQLGGRGAA
jgi:AraC-like DNA-binding protein